MLDKAGSFFAEQFRKWIPDSFAFALVLTFAAGLLSMIVTGTALFDVIQAWHKGFWTLLTFGMQMVLILVTGFAIAISPPADRFIEWVASRIRTPVMVYCTVVLLGCVFSMISWGWIVLTAVLGRELARRVKRVDYRLVAACVYVSFLPWHGGLSGSIPLMLNTENNFLIETQILSTTIPASATLGSSMNIACCLLILLTLPLLMVALRPGNSRIKTFTDLSETGTENIRKLTVAEEAETLRLPGRNLSDGLNNSMLIQAGICLMGAGWLGWHFYNNGFDIDLNVMNFLFIILGMICHRTPVRYVVAMKRSCANVSGILLQFPFYAGIMGIMIHTGLGKAMAMWLAATASVESFPVVAFFIGGLVNIFVPSGGGEWAIVGPTIVNTAKTLGASLSPEQLTAFISRVSMAVAYGDSWSNMIQPFWTLAFFPIIAAGVRIQARDIIGYTFVAMVWTMFIFTACVTWMPI